jgi:hypothetical protein
MLCSSLEADRGTSYHNASVSGALQQKVVVKIVIFNKWLMIALMIYNTYVPCRSITALVETDDDQVKKYSKMITIKKKLEIFYMFYLLQKFILNSGKTSSIDWSTHWKMN